MSHKRRIQTSTTIMKTLKQHIDEALKIGSNLSEWSAYSCQPKTKDELKEIIKERISKEGTNCDLNDIDVSLIKDMSYLFHESEFDGDISDWNVSNVKDMSWLFNEAEFNGDISKWNTSNVRNMERMFSRSWFDDDISDWDVSNVENMSNMFAYSRFNQDISKWKINEFCDVRHIFYSCPIKQEYKPKL